MSHQEVVPTQPSQKLAIDAELLERRGATTSLPIPTADRSQRKDSSPDKYYVAGLIYLVIGIFVAGIVFGLLAIDMGRKASANGGQYGGLLQFAGGLEIVATVIGLLILFTG